MPRFVIQTRFLIVLLACCTACGGNAGPDPQIDDDAGQIASMITEVSDRAGVAESFQEMITADFQADEEQRSRYSRVMCITDRDSVSVDGDAATAEVRIEDIDGSITTVEWTLVKESGVWKIQSAPLP